MKPNTKNVIMTIFFIFFGSLYPVLNSVILTEQFPYRGQLTIRFKKPWFQLWASMLAMSFFSIPAFIKNKWYPKRTQMYSWFSLFRTSGAPSLCMIVATYLQNYGLLSIPPTVWQVFFGFKLLFASLFSVTVLKRQLFLVDWLGLFVSVAGMCFSGVAALLRGTTTSSTDDINEIFTSFVLVIISHGIAAYQTILEERLLHDTQMSSSQLTAFEGIWGFFICTFIALPLCTIMSPTNMFGLYEDSIESFKLIGKSGKLVGLLLGYMLSISLYQFFGMTVTEISTALHRNLYEILRPFFVWIISILFQLFISSINEPLDKYTTLEIGGFLISLVGSLIYNKIIKFPCFLYDDFEELSPVSMSSVRNEQQLHSTLV